MTKVLSAIGIGGGNSVKKLGPGPLKTLGTPTLGPPSAASAALSSSLASPVRLSVMAPGYNFENGRLVRGNTDVQNEMSRRFPSALSSLDTLRGQVKPFGSAFRTAAMGRLRSGYDEAVGNLRTQLARRGLAGASFAADSEGRLTAEFAKQQAEVEADAAGQELDFTLQLIQAEQKVINDAMQQEFKEFGASADLVAAGAELTSMNAAAAARLAEAHFAT